MIDGSNLETTIEEPTAEMRFLGDTLQQRWKITTMNNGVTLGIHGEWRDIPRVDMAKSTEE